MPDITTPKDERIHDEMYRCIRDGEGPWRAGDILSVSKTSYRGTIVYGEPDGELHVKNCLFFPTLYRDLSHGRLRLVWTFEDGPIPAPEGIQRDHLTLLH